MADRSENAITHKENHDFPAKANSNSSSKANARPETFSTGEVVDMELAEGNQTGFMDLPPEIRNQIYGLALKTDKEIRITRHNARPWSQAGRQALTRAHRKMDYKIKGRVLVAFGAKKRRLIFVANARPIAILRVNKIINAEATPLLYGANRFAFVNSCAFIEFKAKTGSSFALLKNVEIQHMSPQTEDDTIRIFTALQAPSRIAIPALERSFYDFRLKEFATRLWRCVRLFATTRADWQQYYLSKGRSYKRVPIVDEGEQRNRLDALVFKVRPSYVVWLEDGTQVKISSSQEGHDLIKAAFVTRLERHMNENKAKRDQNAAAMIPKPVGW